MMLFLLGLIAGSILGMFIMGLCAAGKMRNSLEERSNPLLKI